MGALPAQLAQGGLRQAGLGVCVATGSISAVPPAGDTSRTHLCPHMQSTVLGERGDSRDKMHCRAEGSVVGRRGLQTKRAAVLLLWKRTDGSPEPPLTVTGKLTARKVSREKPSAQNSRNEASTATSSITTRACCSPSRALEAGEPDRSEGAAKGGTVGTEGSVPRQLHEDTG